MLNELKKLCSLNSASGRENEVRDYIIKEISPYAEYSVDPLGNVIAFKKGKNKANKKVMLSAHMDEVALIVTFIDDSGFLKFTTVGGIDTQVLAGKKVIINGHIGVTGVKPIHLLKGNEKDKYPEVDDLYIDIGASSKEDAEKYVTEGDVAYFVSEHIELGDNLLKAKAIDDRLGCAVLLNFIRKPLKNDAYFVFTVQEEVGTRGAATAAFTVAPDYAIVVEATTAADLPSAENENKVCVLGEGAVISFMDRATVYDKDLYKLAFRLGKDKNIKLQTKTKVAGGNDSGAIHKSRGGIKTIAVSIPCRYIHSPSCVINKSDINAVSAITEALLEALSE